MQKRYSLLIILMVLSLCVSAQQNVFPGKQTKQSTYTKMTITPTVINGAQQPLVYTNSVAYSPLVFPRTLTQGPQVKPWEISVNRHPKTGMPVAVNFAQGSFIGLAGNEAEAEGVIADIFSSIGYLYGLKDANELTPIATNTDKLGQTHIKLQQVYQGVPVYGAQLIVHFYTDGSAMVNGRNQPSPAITSTNPTLDADAANSLAITDVATRDYYRPLTDAERDMTHQHQPELVVYPSRNNFGQFNLAWHVTMHNTFMKVWEYFVDAKTGEVLNAYDHTCSVGPSTATATDLMGASRTINTFQATNNTYFMIDASRAMYTGPTNTLPTAGKGAIVTLNLNNTGVNNPSSTDISSPNNSWNNPTAISAHTNSGLAYEYFRTVHGRNSINGLGGDVISFINVADDNGQSMDNAFWNGQYMFYGNGAQAFNKPLARSLDVGGHEMSHGVIQETAGLEYQDESGALNESFADVFGAMIDRSNWILGEDVVNPAVFPTGALRDMQDPHNGGTSLNDPGFQPKHVNEQYSGTNDNGGVHINSGIPNHAFYLFATATSKETAEQVFYRALANYLTKSSNFIDMRIAVVRAATDLHGAGSAEVTAAESAFTAVGIGAGTGTNTNPTLPTNPGTDFVLITDVNSQDPNTLYVANNDATAFTPITTTGVNFRPSVTDDGTVAVFVSTTKNIYAAGLQSNNLFENELTNDNFFQTVAVSKDGSKIAGISVNQDTSIYVYDFTSQQWGRYMLYNPTTGQGINIAGPLFAEALEWDYTGEYLVYDAYNEIPGTPGYWDVSFIKVWNNAGNTFGDGTISKLFTGLPFGVSIGNPSFSKNSPNVLAFDYYDDNTGVFSVLGANIETGDVGTIFQQSVVGTPCYSTNDNLMVFSGRDANNTTDVIGIVNLNPDKLTPAAQPVVFTDNAKWPVWFAAGTRDIRIGIEDVATNDWTLGAYPNPFNNEVNINLSGLNQGEWSVSLYNLMGQLVYADNGTASSDKHNITVATNDLPAGYYLVKASNGKTFKTLKVVKQ